MKCVVFKLWQFFSICCFPQSIGWYPHSHIATTTTGILIFSYICVEFRGFTFSSLLVSSLKKGACFICFTCNCFAPPLRKTEIFVVYVVSLLLNEFRAVCGFSSLIFFTATTIQHAHEGCRRSGIFFFS